MLLGLDRVAMAGGAKVMLPCFYCGFTNFSIPAVDEGDSIEIAFAFDRSWWPSGVYYLCGISGSIWDGVDSGYVAFGYTFADEKCHVVRNECVTNGMLLVDGNLQSKKSKNYSGADFAWGAYQKASVGGSVKFKGWMYWIAVYGSDGTPKRKYVPDEDTLQLKDELGSGNATRYRDTPTYLLREA